MERVLHVNAKEIRAAHAPLFPTDPTQNNYFSFSPAMGLKEAKVSFDTFVNAKINEMMKNNKRGLLSLLSQQDLLDYATVGVTDKIYGVFRQCILEVYFPDMTIVDVIRCLRENPVTIMLILAN
jgi:hypothetical protein